MSQLSYELWSRLGALFVDMLMLLRAMPRRTVGDLNVFGIREEIKIDKHFESSQKLRKDGIGIWKNFIGNMLSNCVLWFWLSTNTYYLSLHLKLCYLNWKWAESDRHFTCYWYIWNTVQNRKVILLNYDIWDKKECTGTEHYTYLA